MKHLITINREVFEQYRIDYFNAKPRARVFPFDTKGKTKKTRYSVLSLNDVLPMDSMMYGALKEKWGDFGRWLAMKNGFTNAQLKNSIIELRVFSETKAHKDCDNVAGGFKLLGDGLYVQSGMYVDDSYNYINPLIIVCDYDKVNPRFEIRITELPEDVKEVYEKIKIHLNNWS